MIYYTEPRDTEYTGGVVIRSFGAGRGGGRGLYVTDIRARVYYFDMVAMYTLDHNGPSTATRTALATGHHGERGSSTIRTD